MDDKHGLFSVFPFGKAAVIILLIGIFLNLCAIVVRLGGIEQELGELRKRAVSCRCYP